MSDEYKLIVSHYEACLEKFGDTHLGVDWPKLDDVEKRYRVMLELENFSRVKRQNYSLLDFGCGAGHLLEYLVRNRIDNFSYSGCDLSFKFVDLCKTKFKEVQFVQWDALKDPNMMGSHDFIVMNGVFTEKLELSFEQMWTFFTRLISILYQKAEIGLAFNLMSKQVEWEREDLFHVSHDLLADFLTKQVSRNYIIRNDYGLYEYTVYLYK